MLDQPAGHPGFYGVEHRRRHKSDLFSLVEDLLWRAGMALEPYLSIFAVPDPLAFGYRRGQSLAESVELQRLFRPEAGIIPVRVDLMTS